MGSGGGCSPGAPPTDKARRCNGVNTHEVVLADLDGEKIIIKPVANQNGLRIEALLLDIFEVELENVNENNVKFQTDQIQAKLRGNSEKEEAMI